VNKRAVLLVIAFLTTCSLVLGKLASAVEVPEQPQTNTTLENLPPEAAAGMTVAVFLGVGILLIYFRKTKRHTNITAHCYELI